MIEIKNVSKSYGALTVLHDVSLTIPEGEIMTIVGPSGAGKTTLLQIAGSLDRPDSGKVFLGTTIFSVSKTSNSPHSETEISVLFSSSTSSSRSSRLLRMWLCLP